VAAPIYSQAEADAMIAMPKRVEYEAWEKRSSGRPTEGESSAEIDVFPEDGNSEFAFKIEIRELGTVTYFFAPKPDAWHS
jgi:hypothetical protein